ncbi:type 2 lanthipeptide synthetase LanM [Mucilaginibacter aquariorum]|uniref:Type 2 lanthipeptide synthetase LanM n=1 Tax=Mucilaginibacter aquariorum TaxID=2967225 RepID=A0ABT1T1W2_9SPHI|nr:type 2 lanthipeptide synthetase LanM [Mucilaginibacter aquariorum]MCQ6958542.1 type 2 lanthipeptide synthetase LanM [Mucilaginibacter aquariorum]
MTDTSASIMIEQALPFGQHVWAITKTELENATADLYNDDKDVVLKALAPVSMFAFDQHFCDFASTINPCFNILQLIDPAFNSTDDLLNDYDEYFFDKNGLAGFLKKYPLVYTLQKDLYQQLNAFYTEILANILADTDSLSQIFNNGQSIGKAIKINISEGDRHQGGKSTAIIEFECGLKLLYKPRSGAMDVAFNTFISQIAKETGIDLKITTVLDRGDHFWMEFIEHLPVSGKNELYDYYIQCGALLAIVFLLGGTDFHFENIIANGKHPVLIDLECLFGATDEMQEGRFSVNNTGLLPVNIYLDEQDVAIDNSGFGAWGRQVSGIDRWAWINMGTDALRLDKQKGIFVADKNQPVYNDIAISPENYLTEIIDGFKRTCTWFITNKDSLDKPGSAFSNFAGKPIRVIMRYTMNYLFIIENSLNAEVLVTEQARKEEIYRSLNEFPTATQLQSEIRSPINDAEFKAIKKMNVPLFNGNTTKLHIRESGDIPEWAFFKTTPYQFTLNRIKNFDTDKMELQISLIKAAFAVRYDTKQKEDNQVTAKLLTGYIDTSILQEVEQIASGIRSSAIKNSNNYSWNSYTTNGNNKLVFDTLSPMLYDGSLGIACFLHMADNFANKEIVDAIISAEVKRAFNAAVDISFASGISGLLYALVKTHTTDNQNLQTAIALTRLINTADISKDHKYDIMAGSAGLLQSLALLYKNTGSASVLNTMTFIGDHLLESRVIDSTSGALTWRGEQFDRPLTGFSHGASGIARALLTLFDCTGIDKYKHAFYQSIKFDNYYQNAQHSNWCDLRKAGSDCKTTWCHGAPGIGLARLHAYAILKEKSLLRDIEIAISTTKKHLLTDVDFYCCGNTGRIDFLIEAAAVLNRPQLLKTARKALLTIINRKNERGYYQTFDMAAVSLENPSLFRGTAGIGYTLLRSINPGEVPCLGLLT